MTSLLCKHCSKPLAKPQGLAIHENSCKSNPNRKPNKGGFRKGYAPSAETRRKIAEANSRRTTSDETKAKISASRIRFLDANPHMVPYVLNHKTNGESYPEKYWREVLTEAGIKFEQELRVSRYRIDFAIGKIALEIDGEQHYKDPRIARSDVRRNAALLERGWTTIRVRWSTYQKMSVDEKTVFRISLLERLKQT